MRRQGSGDLEGGEGQGEIIEVLLSRASLTDLDSSEELLQTGWWGSFKQSHGWQAHPFNVTVTGQRAAAFGLLVLTRTLFRRFVIAYVPFGPAFDPACDRGRFLSLLARALRKHLPRRTLFVRFDLPWEKSGEEPGWDGGSPKVRKSPSDIQPPNTVVVDISGPLEGVLSAMKSKTRYNVRLAEKKGVLVREEGDQSMDPWYAMYRETEPARQDCNPFGLVLQRPVLREPVLQRERARRFPSHRQARGGSAGRQYLHLLEETRRVSHGRLFQCKAEPHADVRPPVGGHPKGQSGRLHRI